MSVSQPLICPGMKGLPPEALEEVAAYFQTLSEPTRLQILNYLREGERNVGELAQIYALCDLVCGNIARQFEQTARDRKAFVRTAARAGRQK